MGTIVIQERRRGCSSDRKDCNETRRYVENSRDGRGRDGVEWWDGMGWMRGGVRWEWDE